MRTTIDRAAWAHRDGEFGALATRTMPDTGTEEVVMSFGPADNRSLPGWGALAALWRELPRNPTLLAVSHVDEAGGIWLDYAALDWKAKTPVRHVETLARWVVQLSRAFERIATLPHASWKHFAKPCVYVDLGRHIRLAFLPPSHEEQQWLTSLPPNERVWVICIAKLVEVAASSDDGTVVIEPGRYKTLRQLREAYQQHFRPETDRVGTAWSAWRKLERGLGWVEMANVDEAVSRLTASHQEVESVIAAAGLERCKELLNPAPPPPRKTDEIETPSWVSRADWEKRSAELGLLTVRTGSRAPVMELVTEDTDEWSQLLLRWQRVQHPNVLRLVPIVGSTAYLHYAAIDWEWKPSSDASRLAGWVEQLVSAFKAITELPRSDWHCFARPVAFIDVGGHVRLGFRPAPPPSGGFDEQSFVQVVGRVLQGLCPDSDDEAMNRLLAIAASDDSLHRFTTLEQLERACARALGRNELVRMADRRRSWESAERGLGFCWLQRWEDAYDAFVEARAIRPIPLAHWGIAVCEQRLKVVSSAALWWRDAKKEIDALEAERDFAGALALYCRVHVTETEAAEIHARHARCQLEAHDVGKALDHANRALDLDASRSDARQVRIRALIGRKAYAEALADADALLAAATHDATAHYLRGKVLVGLGRLAEARDAFDLAIALRPTMIEAMLLRREADRSLGKLGTSVGSQHVELALPESLEPLREILAAGRSKPIIEALSTPSLADDADAQLMLARFLGFAERHEDAIAIYDRYLDSSHRRTALIGKAGALLDTGRIESALALFDVAVAEAPHDADACEGRARTLDTLGRTSEAAAEFRRFVDLGRGGANLRVRVAQIWLDRH